jgi:hypothetical protein
MAQQKSSSNAWLFIVAILAVVALNWPNLDETGWFSHDKMAVVVSRAWTVGEYKACQSYDSGKDNGEPILTCDDGEENAKRFKVSFRGPTYIASQAPASNGWKPTKSQQTTFSWDCRKNNDDDVVFSCWRKEKDKITSPSNVDVQTEPYHVPPEDAQTQPVEQCRTRFWFKGINEINGKSVEAACKDNPNLQP